LIRLIEVVFSNGTMLLVSDRSESVNERTHADQQINKIQYSMTIKQDKITRNKKGTNNEVSFVEINHT